MIRRANDLVRRRSRATDTALGLSAWSGPVAVRIVWPVMLPPCRPALGLIGIFGFTMIWDQYLLPLLVATHSNRFTLPLAAALLTPLPSVIAFVTMQRQFMNGLTSGAIKG